jgi:hypothetical protein
MVFTDEVGDKWVFSHYGKPKGEDVPFLQRWQKMNPEIIDIPTNEYLCGFLALLFYLTYQPDYGKL